MPGRTDIAWATDTWNPTTGCSKVSEGCRHCYAETLSLAKGWSTKPWTRPNADDNVKIHTDRFHVPLRWNQPRIVFVNSMSDLFHEVIDPQVIAQVFGIMALARRHVFLVLTKRPERMRDLLNRGEFRADVQKWYDITSGRFRPGTGQASLFSDRPSDIPRHIEWPLPNVWLGTSVEDQRAAVTRVPHLIGTDATCRFLSCEPLLGAVDLEHVPDPGFRTGVYNALTGEWWPAVGDPDEEHRRREIDGAWLDWIIVGGESGTGHRTMDLAWALSLFDQCQTNGTAFFFKQDSGLRPGQAGRAPEPMRTTADYPPILREYQARVEQEGW